jgi:dihydropteroate synthase
MDLPATTLDLFERLDHAVAEARRLIAERADMIDDTRRSLRKADLRVYSDRAAALRRTLRPE